MYKLIFCLVFSMAVLNLSAETLYGDAIPQGPTTTLASAISALDGDESKPMRISGLVTEACTKKGCWMVLVDGDQYARVRFNNYSVTVPLDTANQQAVIYGRLQKKQLSQKQAEHFARDAGDTETKYPDGKTEYTIMADSALLMDKEAS